MPNTRFDFSRRERQGIACLLILICLIHSWPFVWTRIRPAPPPADTLGLADTERKVAALMAGASRARARRYDSMRASWKRTPFRRDTAFRKRWHADSAGKKKYEKKPPPLIQINASDSTEWEQLPYIGPGYAGRIVRFRERLGGFHSVIQVSETFGLPDSVFNKIQPYLRLGDESLRKIDINETDEKSLADHPYINTKLARAIIRYRNANGRFRQVLDLRALPLVNDSIYRKIEKYLIAP